VGVLGALVLGALLSFALRYRLSEVRWATPAHEGANRPPPTTAARSQGTLSSEVGWAMPRTSPPSVGQNPAVNDYASNKPFGLESGNRRTATPLAASLNDRTQTGVVGTYDAAGASNQPVDPTAVIGRPFPVSPSVESGCKLDDSCSDLHQMLSRFAEEPRDPAWASEMEGKLRDLVMLDSGEYTVRDVECRTSICLVEVASLYGVYYRQIPADNPLSKRLLPMAGDWGYELDPNSARVTVTIAPFRRR
jgi:hypothetical protein